MDDLFAKLYEYAQVIPAVKEIAENIYSDRLASMKKDWTELEPLFAGLCDEISVSSKEEGEALFEKIKNAASLSYTDPFNLKPFADELIRLVPDLQAAIATFGAVDEKAGRYRLISSDSGFLSLQNSATGTYYHSLNDPMWEARVLAGSIYDPTCFSYKILGCGLGYLPWQLFVRSDQSADIYVYHTDAQAVELALDYGVLSWIPEEKLHIITDTAELNVLGKLTEELPEGDKCGYYFARDGIEALSEKGRSLVRNVETLCRTSNTFFQVKSINIQRNIKRVERYFTEFKPVNSEEWIVVAAGPSLDDNIEYIRSSKGKKTVIAVSTVLKRLLSEGITPDCVVALDGQARTYGHFDGLSDFRVPLLLSVTANWRFGELYKGEKYLVPCVAAFELQEEFKRKGIVPLWLGSTVSSMAISVAAAFGAKHIELVGLDLSYPTGMSHAKGLMDTRKKPAEGMDWVECQTGGKVLTTPQFMVYISEINELIRKNPDVKFVNRSRIGAKFEGAESINTD